MEAGVWKTLSGDVKIFSARSGLCFVGPHVPQLNPTDGERW